MRDIHSLRSSSELHSTWALKIDAQISIYQTAFQPNHLNTYTQRASKVRQQSNAYVAVTSSWRKSCRWIVRPLVDHFSTRSKIANFTFSVFALPFADAASSCTTIKECSGCKCRFCSKEESRIRNKETRVSLSGQHTTLFLTTANISLFFLTAFVNPTRLSLKEDLLRVLSTEDDDLPRDFNFDSLEDTPSWRLDELVSCAYRISE